MLNHFTHRGIMYYAQILDFFFICDDIQLCTCLDFQLFFCATNESYVDKTRIMRT